MKLFAAFSITCKALQKFLYIAATFAWFLTGNIVTEAPHVARWGWFWDTLSLNKGKLQKDRGTCVKIETTEIISEFNYVRVHSQNHPQLRQVIYGTINYQRGKKFSCFLLRSKLNRMSVLNWCRFWLFSCLSISPLGITENIANRVIWEYSLVDCFRINRS